MVKGQRGSRWVTVWAGLVVAGAVHAQDGPRASEASLRQACDAVDHFTVLQPTAMPAAGEARGVWLDASRIQWSGASAREGAITRLALSEEGRLDARVGDRLQGADRVVPLTPDEQALPADLRQRSRYLPQGLRFSLPVGALQPADWRAQMLLVQEDAQGRVLEWTRLQHARALDEVFASAESVKDLGAIPSRAGASFKLWAPTAHQVHVCLYPGPQQPAAEVVRMQADLSTGVWSLQHPAARAGQYITYLVDVHVPGAGRVRNRVTDPYSVALSADSRRTMIADLEAPELAPPGWRASRIPDRVKRPTDLVIYELHVRDFSVGDDSVPPGHRGTYLGFTHTDSRGMRHLRSLSQAGLTDVHLLPVFDFATVPERGCAVPPIDNRDPAGESQQAAVTAVKDRDCFNWGYDPLHYTAPEGSFSTQADDGARRILEFRRMVMALHQAGLRVGMDVVYNHTSAAGQKPQSVLDRIVPGYYHRLNAAGEVERSTCCDNTATEHRMMAKLMLDSVVTWARHYKIASFRFDLMGHQPREAMERLQRRLKAEVGREVQLLGEGWNFGEVADGARFVQASQLSLNGTGIGTFSDRTRDAVRGGSAGDSGLALVQRQGWINGLGTDRNAAAPEADRATLLRMADMVRVGLAGTLRSYRMTTAEGDERPLERLDYGGQPAGYASRPAEVVNYVENHDNQTLFDNNVLKLPRHTSRQDRARVQVLGAAVTAFSQGVAYFHAGLEILRSKSLDRNSYDSGDWFNRLDWRLADNGFAAGLPPAHDNAASWPVFREFLADPAIKPTATEIGWTRDAFLDLLRIRASSSLFRLETADEVQRRLRFFNTGPSQQPAVVAAHLDGRGRAGAGFRELAYLVNVDTRAHEIEAPSLKGRRFELHPVHIRPDAADRRARSARFDAATARFTVPPRTAVVFVVR